MKKYVWGIVLFLMLAGCGVERQYENYDTLTLETDLTLTQQNHPHGFRQTQCFMCHVKRNIHQVNRIQSPVFDLAKEVVETYGISGCNICHGDNGL